MNLGGIQIIIKSGSLIPVLLMLPNLVWMLLPKADFGEHRSAPLIITIVENVGRALVLILPLFYTLDLYKKHSVLAMGGMGLALAVYYISWTRFFASGRLNELFRAPLFGIPLPMAVAPTVFLVLSSYLMGSWLMFGASVLFGVTHIWVSAMSL